MARDINSLMSELSDIVNFFRGAPYEEGEETEEERKKREALEAAAKRGDLPALAKLAAAHSPALEPVESSPLDMTTPSVRAFAGKLPPFAPPVPVPEEPDDPRQIPGAMSGFRFPGGIDNEMKKLEWLQRMHQGNVTDPFGGESTPRGRGPDAAPFQFDRTPFTELTPEEGRYPGQADMLMKMHQAIKNNTPLDTPLSIPDTRTYTDMLRAEKEQGEALEPGAEIEQGDEALKLRALEAATNRGWLEWQKGSRGGDTGATASRTNLAKNKLAGMIATALGFASMNDVPDEFLDNIAAIAVAPIGERSQMLATLKKQLTGGQASFRRAGALQPTANGLLAEYNKPR